jgi:HK97 family phage major capsid protein
MDYDINDTAPEHKSGISSAARGEHDAVMAMFEEFKASNDERLASMGRRADVLLDEKVDRINGALDAQMKRIDDLALKSARPALDGGRGRIADATAREHKSAFDAYVRQGESAGLRVMETKALSTGSNADGGYLVPVELEHEIGQRLAAISPIRAISSVREISGNVYKKPFMTAGPATGWVGETDARTQTTSPTLDALSFPAMELYAMPAATATLLDDSAVNIDEWIASEVELTFAVQEGAAFVNGDGSNKPKGFLNYTAVANGSWTWGNLGYVASGSAGAFPGSNPSDVLVDTIYALKAGYRQNGNS